MAAFWVFGAAALVALGAEILGAAGSRSFGRRLAAEPARRRGTVGSAGAILAEALLSGTERTPLAMLSSLSAAGGPEQPSLALSLVALPLGCLVWAWALAGAAAIGAAAYALPILALAVPFRLRGPFRDGAAAAALGAGLLLLGLGLLNDSTAFPATLFPAGELAFFAPRSILFSGLAAPAAFVISLFVSAALGSPLAALAFLSVPALRLTLAADAMLAVVLGANCGKLVPPLFGALLQRTASRESFFWYAFLNAVSAGVLFMARDFVPVFISGTEGQAFYASFLACRLQTLFIAAYVGAGLIFLLLLRLFPRSGAAERGEGNGARSALLGRPLPLAPSSIPDAMNANLIVARSAAAELAESVREMLLLVMNATDKVDAEETARRFDDRSREATALGGSLDAALRTLAREPCTEEQATIVLALEDAAYQLGGIAEAGRKASATLAALPEGGFGEKAAVKLRALIASVLDLVGRVADGLRGGGGIGSADDMTKAVESAGEKILKRSRKEIEKGRSADVRAELALMDFARAFIGMGKRCSAIIASLDRANGLRP